MPPVKVIESQSTIHMREIRDRMVTRAKLAQYQENRQQMLSCVRLARAAQRRLRIHKEADYFDTAREWL